MAKLIEWNGIGLTQGSLISAGSAGTGDTPISVVQGATPTVDLNDAQTPSIFFDSAGAGSTVRWTLSTAHTELRARFYFKTPPAWASISHALFEFRDSASAPTVRVAIAGTGAPGQIRLANAAATNVATSSNGLMSTNTWYRCELKADIAGGIARLMLYLGNSSVSIYDSNDVASSYGTSADRIWLGTINNSPDIDSKVAHVVVTDQKNIPIGAYGTPGVVTVAIWDGSIEQPAHYAIWDGTTEHPASVS